jgi:hypothetical protein
MKNIGNLNAKDNDRVGELEEQVRQLTERLRMVPSTFAGGGDVAEPAVYIVIGGKTLADWGADGGKRKTSALTAGDLPAGTGGSPGETVIVPATPIPPGLPDGICVGALISSGATAWILCDSTSYVASDLVQGDRVIVSTAPVVYDVSSGGVIYRYNLLRAFGRA